MPESVDLTSQHDLDNYAYPLASRLAKVSGRTFTSVWCSKQHGRTSRLGIATAIQVPERELAQQRWMTVHTSAAAATGTTFKEQVSEQIELQAELLRGEGPVALQLSFTVGTRRNWQNLWKATIDSLDCVLGRTDPNRTWHPKDGRITELGLHRHVDASLGNDVLIAISAQSALLPRGEVPPTP